MRRLFNRSKNQKGPIPIIQPKPDPVTIVPLENTMNDVSRYSLLTEEKKQRKLSHFNQTEQQLNN